MSMKAMRVFENITDLEVKRKSKLNYVCQLIEDLI